MYQLAAPCHGTGQNFGQSVGQVWAKRPNQDLAINGMFFSAGCVVTIDRPAAGLAPVIILCAPQLGENIGACARAMANFGLMELRLVAPRDGWPNPRAVASASGADTILQGAGIFERLEDAISDLNLVFATTARSRDLAKPVCGPDMAALAACRLADNRRRTGYVFGRERWGLDNDEVALADEIVTLPVDPGFASLNIAQAVIICAYEWRKHRLTFPSGDGNDSSPAAQVLPAVSAKQLRLAPKQELFALFAHLEDALGAVGFFHPAERRPRMIRNLRAALQKASLSSAEIRGFRGMITALAEWARRPAATPGRDPSSKEDS